MVRTLVLVAVHDFRDFEPKNDFGRHIFIKLCGLLHPLNDLNVSYCFMDDVMHFEMENPLSGLNLPAR